MKAKSLAVSIITTLILVIGGYAHSFSPAVQAWLGISSFGLTLVLTTFFPSGTLVKGWNWIVVATNATGILLQLLSAVSDKGLLPVEVVNGLIVAVNIFIQGFLKDYTAAPAAK